MRELVAYVYCRWRASSRVVYEFTICCCIDHRQSAWWCLHGYTVEQSIRVLIGVEIENITYVSLIGTRDKKDLYVYKKFCFHQWYVTAIYIFISIVTNPTDLPQYFLILHNSFVCTICSCLSTFLNTFIFSWYSCFLMQVNSGYNTKNMRAISLRW